MTYSGKVICTFVIPPDKPRFQTKTWIRAITTKAHKKEQKIVAP